MDRALGNPLGNPLGLARRAHDIASPLYKVVPMTEAGTITIPGDYSFARLHLFGRGGNGHRDRRAGGGGGGGYAGTVAVRLGGLSDRTVTFSPAALVEFSSTLVGIGYSLSATSGQTAPESPRGAGGQPGMGSGGDINSRGGTGGAGNVSGVYGAGGGGGAGGPHGDGADGGGYVNNIKVEPVNGASGGGAPGRSTGPYAFSGGGGGGCAGGGASFSGEKPSNGDMRFPIWLPACVGGMSTPNAGGAGGLGGGGGGSGADSRGLGTSGRGGAALAVIELW